MNRTIAQAIIDGIRTKSGVDQWKMDILINQLVCNPALVVLLVSKALWDMTASELNNMAIDWHHHQGPAIVERELGADMLLKMMESDMITDGDYNEMRS